MVQVCKVLADPRLGGGGQAYLFGCDRVDARVVGFVDDVNVYDESYGNQSSRFIIDPAAAVVATNKTEFIAIYLPARGSRTSGLL